MADGHFSVEFGDLGKIADQLSDPLRDIIIEIDRAMRKFPTWPTDPLHALAVLGGEYGELTRATLQAIYEPAKAGPGDVRDEAIQTAAMALRFLLSLDRYEYTPAHQHRQDRTEE